MHPASRRRVKNAKVVADHSKRMISDQGKIDEAQTVRGVRAGFKRKPKPQE